MQPRILLVDDEPDIRELLRVSLSQAGFAVETASDAEEVFNALRRARPDLLILDLMLPDRSGTEICREIRSDPALAPLGLLPE